MTEERRLTKSQADRIARECAGRAVEFWTKKRIKKVVLAEIKNRDHVFMPGDQYHIKYTFEIDFRIDDRGRVVKV